MAAPFLIMSLYANKVQMQFSQPHGSQSVNIETWTQVLTTITQNAPVLTQCGWEGQVVGGGVLQTTQHVIQPRRGGSAHLSVLQHQDGRPSLIGETLELIESSVQTVHRPQLHVVQGHEEGVLQVTHHLRTRTHLLSPGGIEVRQFNKLL